MGSRYMTPAEARTAMRLAGEVHRDKRPLPPEIVEKKRQIEAAIKNAELFLARLRVVDEGMVMEIVRMKLELDGLYCAWTVRETPMLH